MDHTPPRLLLDCMLGRLARWLRLIGYDAAYESIAEDQELARRARAEARVLLTRDQELAGRRGLRALLICSQVLDDQVRQVTAAFPISPSAQRPRCSVCNCPLDPVEPSKIAGRAPPYIVRSHSEFRQCSCCGRVYWPGSHFDAIQESIDRYGIGDGVDD
jgi:uncharacterized protein with PIN domain